MECEDVIECVYLMNSDGREEREREKVIRGVIEKNAYLHQSTERREEEN
jgi:hypothetical protein